MDPLARSQKLLHLYSGNKSPHQGPPYAEDRKHANRERFGQQLSLDNPVVLEQQFEALTYRKNQLDKNARKNYSLKEHADSPNRRNTPVSMNSIGAHITQNSEPTSSEDQLCYSLSGGLQLEVGNSFAELPKYKCEVKKNVECDYPPLPSPVSSSYSELRRASDMPIMGHFQSDVYKEPTDPSSSSSIEINYANEGYFEPKFRGSLVYESIYEPINFHSLSDISTNVNYDPHRQHCSQGSSTNRIDGEVHIYANRNVTFKEKAGFLTNDSEIRNQNNVDVLSDYLADNLIMESDFANFGVCFKCKRNILKENTGCSAMDKTYHISCFTCSQCHTSLQGKPFYPVDGEPYCESDYLQTLEKCSVCLKPILERILRATGKPYHPICFKCVVCGNSLDGIPFTVDATNQIYCLSDFHKKFAPRCCVCKQPIMPASSKEETVRVVALDRSFHPECYKCEDCGLLLTSDADGRGCYPLDNHILCKGCNAMRVQHLTNHITSEY